jgi:hypothetical protein
MLGVKIETSRLSFSNDETITYNFTLSYLSAPSITLTCSEDINVFVDSISSSQVVVRAENSGTFTVDIHVIGK